MNHNIKTFDLMSENTVLYGELNTLLNEYILFN